MTEILSYNAQAVLRISHSSNVQRTSLAAARELHTRHRYLPAAPLNVNWEYSETTGCLVNTCPAR
jgi:hypothetical protein